MTGDHDFAKARADLSALRSLGNPLEVQIRTAAVIASALERLGHSVVVVGGSAVSFYTGGAYLSRDVDLVTTASAAQLRELLTGLGFERRNGAWVHADTDVIVDFPAPPLAGDPQRTIHINTVNGPVAVIGLEDLLVDRLSAVVHWKDTEAREWCIAMLALHHDLDMDYLYRRAESSGIGDELRAVLREAREL
jgi:predicted nucleotidyltransferase